MARPRIPDDPGDREELMRLLWRAARKGSVQAMRILLNDMEGTPVETAPQSVIDELARRRESRTG